MGGWLMTPARMRHMCGVSLVAGVRLIRSVSLVAPRRALNRSH